MKMVPESFGYNNLPGNRRKEPLECRLVYVHPKGRYYEVEFEFPGGKVRESYLGRPEKAEEGM